MRDGVVLLPITIPLVQFEIDMEYYGIQLVEYLFGIVAATWLVS